MATRKTVKRPKINQPSEKTRQLTKQKVTAALKKVENQPALPNSSIKHTWENMTVNPQGAPALFDNAEYFLACCRKYFEWCIANPLYKYEAVKSGENCGILVEVPTARPFTLHGLCVFIQANPSWFRTNKARFKKLIHEVEAGADGGEVTHIGLDNPAYLRAKNFEAAFSLIESIIYQQKYEYAATNIFNANFIARDLNLQDTSNVNHTLAGQDHDDLPPVTAINVHDTRIGLPNDEDDVED